MRWNALLALSPSSALALSFSAIIHAWAGDYATAVQQAEQSLRLSTFGSLLAMRYVGLADAHFYAGRCEQALLATNRAPQVNQQFSVPWVLRTTNLGRNEELRASVQRLLELRPASRRTSGDAGKLCAGPEYRTSDADGVQ